MNEDIKDVLVYMVLPVAIVILIISIYCGVQFGDPLCYVKNQCYVHTYTEDYERAYMDGFRDGMLMHDTDYGTVKLERKGG